MNGPFCAPGAPRGSTALAQSQVPMWLVPWVVVPGGHKEAAAQALLPWGAALLWKEEVGSPHPRTLKADQMGGWWRPAEQCQPAEQLTREGRRDDAVCDGRQQTHHEM